MPRPSADPLLRQAIELNGFEEARHKTVLANLVEAYGIKLAPEPDYVAPRDPEWAFMVTGYSECIDSFFAFGLFELARRSGYFPPELVDTFEPVMQEEGRHITVLRQLGRLASPQPAVVEQPLFQAKILAVWAFLIWERIGIARGSRRRARRTTTSPSPAANRWASTSTPPELMEICLAENDRRLAGYDPRLLRPRFVPGMVRLARRFMGKAKPRRGGDRLGGAQGALLPAFQ